MKTKNIFLLEKHNNGAFVIIDVTNEDLILNRYILDTLKRPIHKNNTSIPDFMDQIKKANRIKIIVE